MRRAGQSVRDHARVLVIVWASLSVIALAAELLVGRAFGHSIPWWVMVTVAAVAPGVVERGWLRTQLRNWFVGARGEEEVGRILAALEGEGFRALHDIEVDGLGNIDHVVLGPTGAFAIETKAWSGRVYPRAGRLHAMGVDRQKAVRQATREAMEVGNRLRHAGIDAWVTPVIALTRARFAKQLTFRQVKVVRAQDLPALLRAPSRTTLSTLEIARCVAAVARDQSWRAQLID